MNCRCGQSIKQTKVGRKKVYCSNRCKKIAYRKRKSMLGLAVRHILSVLAR